MKTRIERLYESALREKAVTFSHTAPMIATSGKQGRVKSFLRRVKTKFGQKLARVKAHMRKHKGKYLAAGAVGLAGAAMLHKAAKVESPRYAKFVKKHTDGFTKSAGAAMSAAKKRLRPHVKSYQKDLKWLRKKAGPVAKTAAKYPRMSLLVGALAAERAHKFAKGHSKSYRTLSAKVGKKLQGYVDDSFILQTAKAEMENRIGARLGRAVAKGITDHAEDAIYDATNYGYRVARGKVNPLQRSADDVESVKVRRVRKKKKGGPKHATK